MKTKTTADTATPASGRFRQRVPSPIFRHRSGFGTLEVVIIIAVLLTVAMIFRHSLISFARNLIDTVFNQNSVIDQIAVE